MQHLHHHHHTTTPHVIHLIDAWMDSKYVYLVMPYLTGGDLFTLIDSMDDKGLPEAQAAR